MSKQELPKRSSKAYLVLTKIIYSRPIALIIKIPPIPWIIQKLTFLMVKTARKKLQRDRVAGLDVPNETVINKELTLLDAELQLLAHDIVHSLGFAGAMVAAYEQGDALPARAFYVDPAAIATMEQVKLWEEEVRRISPPDHPISITDPVIARVYINKEKYKSNLSVRAAKKQDYIISNDLFDLFTPIAPEVSRSIIKGIQEAVAIKQVLALPFFIETQTEPKSKEYVGNLFVAKEDDFSDEDIRMLKAFSRHAASSILSERRRLQRVINQKLILDMQRNISSEEHILQQIVRGVVDDLGYMGAMVATFERGYSVYERDVLPVRALYVDPTIATEKQINAWEDEVRKIGPPNRPISITDPAIARVYVYKDEFQENLSVQAFKAGVPVISNELFELFIPIAPSISRSLIRGIQDALEIRQVIAVPFFLDGKFIGNLFAATQSERFSSWEIELLQAFGQNAAAGIRNAKIYRESEERRDASQRVGRMAFSASASIHAFRNHIGLIRGSLGVLESLHRFDKPKQAEILEKLVPPIKERINLITEIIMNLQEPWKMLQDSEINVNDCIKHALRKIIPTWENESWVQFNDIGELPLIKNTQEMMVEAFKILIKNAREAISERSKVEDENWTGTLLIESRFLQDQKIIEVNIKDNGIGIEHENFNRLFQFGISTKSTGLGFGLFWLKDYIEGLDGDVFFDSEFGKGTVFTVHIPTTIVSGD